MVGIDAAVTKGTMRSDGPRQLAFNSGKSSQVNSPYCNAS